MTFNDWVQLHSITPAAMRDLQQLLCSYPSEPIINTTGSEASGQQKIRLEGSKRGIRLWRNNVGACTDDRGNHVRFGLMNDSAPMNKKIKSPDLIGITPTLITHVHMGATLGVFTGYECKKPGWEYKGDQREQSQLNAVNLIKTMGGIAQFATGPGDIW